MECHELVVSRGNDGSFVQHYRWLKQPARAVVGLVMALVVMIPVVVSQDICLGNYWTWLNHDMILI